MNRIGGTAAFAASMFTQQQQPQTIATAAPFASRGQSKTGGSSGWNDKNEGWFGPIGTGNLWSNNRIPATPSLDGEATGTGGQKTFAANVFTGANGLGRTMSRLLGQSPAATPDKWNFLQN